MLEIVSRNGKWNDHDWHLLCRDKSGEYIFYAPTLRIALSISKALAESIHSTGGLPESITSRLIRNSKTQVFPLVERPKSAFYLAIGLTNNCTLACDYCHAEADRDTTINHELIAKSIDYAFEKAAETPKKTLSVSFAVGGEPTMNWKEFIYTVNRIRELEKAHDGVDKVYLSMTTNCYYGAEKREFVANNFDVLTLSIDGHQEIQNIHRPTRAHKGSYTLVSETCKFFIDSNKVKAGLRGTVSNYSVKKLVDVVEHYFNTFGTGYTVAFEPLIEIGRALEGKLMPPTNEEFAMNFWAARTRGKELGLRVITSAANVDRLVGRYCGAMAMPSFTVCTNGKVTACHRDQDGTDYVYGMVDADTGTVTVDEQKIKANVKQTEMPDYCNHCFAKWHCAGDCPDIRRIGYSRCDINRFLVFKQLNELLTKGGETR